jgi:glycerol-3-phosphate dehydrogenase
MVVIVGGGATGLGVGWDLALRGVAVTVVESGELGAGTSGRFHGLLHSGGRYAVSDPEAARECAEEARILSRMAPDAVESTGGYFVAGPEDAEDYAGTWQGAAARSGVLAREVDPSVLVRRVPALRSDVRRAFWVPDGVLEGFRLLEMLRAGIVAHGGQVRTPCRFVGLEVSAGRVVGARVQDQDGTAVIACGAVVNAAGPYAGAVAGLAGIPLHLSLSAGLMLIFANRIAPWPINRLAWPGDGDIVVPHQSVSILGTTDVPVVSPEAPPPRRDEAERLMQLGARLFPRIGEWRVLRAFAGVRPLYAEASSDGDTRRLSRDFTVLDHGERGGPEGFYSIVGGKWTTFRLMAERTADAVAAHLGVDRPCLTRVTPLPPLRAPTEEGPWICECEQVGAEALARAAVDPLPAVRTQTWVGMGPCQGTFCLHRVAAARAAVVGRPAARAELDALRAERQRGMEAVLWGGNARQWALLASVRRQSLDEPGAAR